MGENSEVAAALRDLRACIDNRHEENQGVMSELKRGLDEQGRQLEKVLEGFAEDDPHGHRKYHEEVMREIRARRQLWIELRAHLIKNGLWAGVIGFSTAAWFYLKSKLHS